MKRKSVFDHSLFETKLRAHYTSRIKMLLSAISFWCAIALPVVYFSILLVGPESTTGIALFFGLVVSNVLALIGGRPYCNAIER